MEIMKNDIPELLSVESIRTVYDIQLKGDEPRGEAHDFPEIIYVCKGENTVLVDGKRIELSEGMMTVYPPGGYHIGESPSTARVHVITFDTSSGLLSSLYGRAIYLNPSQREMLGNIISSGLELFERIPRSQTVIGMKKKEGASEYELQRLKKSLELFLIGLLSAESRKETNPKIELFDSICMFLRANLGRSVTLGEVALEFHMGKSSLTALFREKCGEGMISYFNRIKIEEAQRMMLEGRMNVTEISDSLGFASIHYFSRLFKRISGLSPTEYRRFATERQ